MWTCVSVPDTREGDLFVPRDLSFTALRWVGCERRNSAPFRHIRVIRAWLRKEESQHLHERHVYVCTAYDAAVKPQCAAGTKANNF